MAEDLVHKGHRQRMRRKFSEFTPRVFDTYELLEMLLYNTVPVKDTNPIAKRLLLAFGGLDGVLSADPCELIKVEGVGIKTAEMIRTVGKALELCNDALLSDDNGVTPENYDTIGEYLVRYFSRFNDCRSALLTFDNNMKLIAIDEVYPFDFSSAAVRSRDFVDLALKRGAAITVIAHNHPYGPLCPTEGDVQTNKMIDSLFADIGIFLVEHYVISGSSYLGFMNHLENLSHVLSQSSAVDKFFESKRKFNHG